MKDLTRCIAWKAPALKLAAFALTILALGSQSQAQVYSLAHGNSSVAINVASQAGMYNWQVDGQNQLQQQWFWYRVGDNRQASIDTLGTPTVSRPDSRNLYTSYHGSQFSLNIDYQLTGADLGSGVSSMQQTITVKNTSCSELVFHFYQYADFDLAGTSAFDSVQLGKDLSGRFNEARQVNGDLAVSQTANVPGANHGEVALFGDTLNKLNGLIPVTLSDAAGPLGPGNVAWALEWDLVLPAGASKIIGQDLNLTRTVPEPSSVAMLSLGLAVCLLRRKPEGRNPKAERRPKSEGRKA